MSRQMLPTMLAVVIVLVVAIASACATTRGFRALTSDKARQVAFEGSPTKVPDIALVDSRDRVVALRDAVAEKPFTVVSLVYTQCTTLCLLTTSGEAYLQERLRSKGLGSRVGLLTISFDPARDTPEALSRYARRVKARPEHWRIATVGTQEELDRLLDAFGVVVIPGEDGELIHNGALFLVDREGRIFDAFDPDAADEVMARLTTLRSK